jgi:DNA-binding transcriptional LysR family regulator
MDINFELYKIFYQTAKLESFSAAAAQMFISQSAVSQSIKKLEDKMGTKLFYRKARNVKLTKEGEILFSHIEQAYNFIKSGESKITEMQNMDYGEIRIGVGDTICKYFLIPYLESFILKHTRIKIQVINRTSSQIISLLKSGSIDLGIVTMPVEDPDISVSEFMAVEDIFIACNKYSDLKDRVVPLKELCAYPLLMLEKKSATRKNLDSFLENQNISISPELELESIDLLVEFAKIGLGVAHVLNESAASEIKRGDLFKIITDTSLPQRLLGIATMRDMPLSKAANEFINVLRRKGFPD